MTSEGMTRRRANFTQADVTRAIRGAQAAGLRIVNVEIDLETGVLVIVTDQAPEVVESGRSRQERRPGRIMMT